MLINVDWACFFFFHLEILYVGERHLEVCKAWIWCKYYLKIALFLSFSHFDTNKVLRSQLKKGKLHGCIDVGLSVMSIKKKAMCIDLDTEDNIYHLKVTPDTHINKSFVELPSLRDTVYANASTPTCFLSHLHFMFWYKDNSCCLQVSVPNLTLWHAGEVSRAVWGVGVKAASPPRVSAEWDCHVSPREAPLQSPRLVLTLPQWLHEKSKLFHLLVCIIAPLDLTQ